MIKLARAGSFHIIGKFVFDLVIKRDVFAKPGIHAPVDLWSG